MASLTLLYDGGCPLCLREVTFLRGRDARLHPGAPLLDFVDIDDPEVEVNGSPALSQTPSTPLSFSLSFFFTEV